MTDFLAEVAVFSALEKTLHYSVPAEFRERVKPGVRVLVPLAARRVVGLILSLDSSPPDVRNAISFRPLLAVIDSSPVLPISLIDLCRWISQYYFYPLGEVLQTALPKGIQSKLQEYFLISPAGIEAVQKGNPSLLLRELAGKGKILDDHISNQPISRKRAREELRTLEKKGYLSRSFEWKTPSIRPKTVKNVSLLPSVKAIHLQNEKMAHVVRIIEQGGGSLPLKTLRSQVKNLDYWIKKLLEKGMVQMEDAEEIRESHHIQFISDTSRPELTTEQRGVLEAIIPLITLPKFQTFLISGVTGSGKTEIYLRLAEKALELDKGTLVLVPEIALSTQMEAVFRQRFGSQLAVWHSSLSVGTRYDQWREALSGKRKVILGVRSAAFMPVRHLGLIIVDEEHDFSYKQDDHLRYNARDVSLVRARMAKIPIVLGSATPSLQSVHHCQTERYRLLSLPWRIHNRPLPDIEPVDMRRESGRNRILSQKLKDLLLETVHDGQQALLFLNRRGFANFILCSVCGQVIQCSNCSVSLTYHQKENHLKCHYCGGERKVPVLCPTCGHGSLIRHGFGTERVEEEVKRILPESRTVRIDRDTVNHPRIIVEYLNAVRNSQVNILIGTQMVAKGHDFPDITLVGVVNADTALQVPDFRSGEITVQLLMQVAGRAGRGDKPGRVILQTYNPSHYTIQAVLKRDYLTFCNKELASRKELRYPPYTRLTRLLITGTSQEVTQQAAYQIADICRRTAEQYRKRSSSLAVLGPSPAPIAKLKRRYRWHIFVKSWTNSVLQEFTESVLLQSKSLSHQDSIQIAVDRDPISSM